MNFAASSDVELFGLVAKLAASPEAVRFAAEVAAAGEVFEKMIGKVTMSDDLAAFLATVERESVRCAEWQRQHSAVFAQPRGPQRLRKRTIVRPEVTTQIGFHRR